MLTKDFVLTCSGGISDDTLSDMADDIMNKHGGIVKVEPKRNYLGVDNVVLVRYFGYNSPSKDGIADTIKKYPCKVIDVPL